MEGPGDTALGQVDSAGARAEPQAGLTGWEGGDRPVPLAARFDESAAAVHGVTAAKMVLALFGALMAALVVRPQMSAGWLAGAVALAAWTWLLTRPQARGVAIGWRRRGGFVASLAGENLWWMLLGALLWGSGAVAGQASAVIIWAALVGVSVLLFYNAPVVFLAAGSSPAIAALTVVALRGHLGWRDLLPIWIGVALSIVFNLGRALETPSGQASKRRLNDSLNRFRILAENVTDVIVRTDLEGKYQYVSPASLAVLGYRPDELFGTYVPARHVAVLQAMRERMLASPGRTEALTLQVRRKDGSPIWLQTNAKMVCEGGVPVGVIGVSRDVTERIAADIALREAKVEAEAANRAKAEFLANVSHEIRTPMNGVLGALHLLERESISAEGRELMRQAKDCGRMLSQLLNDVLDFSRIESGQFELAPEAMDVGEALETVIALLAGEAGAKGVELRHEITGEPRWIGADPTRVRQLMFNLVGNAVKFTLRGHVAVRLAVEAVGDGARRRVTLEVEDTGIGISAEAQKRLFERFRQAESDTARRFGGTGLGLAISQGVARAMGGQIGCTSVEGEGSTFRLQFEAPGSRPVGGAAPDEGLLEGVNILLVEDNPTNRLVARTMLTRLGANVREAEDGLAGLEAARGGGHDLILMDVQMPRMNGVEATRAIRALPGPASQAPIIGLTANVMVHQRAEYFGAGMDGVVAKPISPAALITEITRLLTEEARQASDAEQPRAQLPALGLAVM